MFVCAINSIGKSHFAFFNLHTLYVVTYKMRRGVRTLFRTSYVDRFRTFALSHFRTSHFIHPLLDQRSNLLWVVGSRNIGGVFTCYILLLGSLKISVEDIASMRVVNPAKLYYGHCQKTSINYNTGAFGQLFTGFA